MFLNLILKRERSSLVWVDLVSVQQNITLYNKGSIEKLNRPLFVISLMELMILAE